MTEKIYQLGIDIGNRLVKVMGDENETPLIYPASLARYEEVSYVFNNNIDYLENNDFKIFSLKENDEQSCYVWGKKLFKFGQEVIDTNGTGGLRSSDRLYRELVLFAIANYAEGLYDRNLTDKVVLSVAMGMPDDEYFSEAANHFASINWLIGTHVVYIDNLPIEFEIRKMEVMPQEFGSLVLYEKLQGGINPDVRTMVIDYGGVTRLRTVYDGFQQREMYQDTSGVNQLIQVLVNRLKDEGIKNNRRNNRINIQEMLMSQNFKLKTGVNKEKDFSEIFQKETKAYTRKRFEDDLYSGQNFNNIDLIILTGGGANLLEESLYSSLVSELWVPESPETANVRGFYEYLKYNSDDIDKAEDITFNIGDQVKISDRAEIEANGYDLKPHRNWIGEIIEITKIEDEENSYTVQYPSGEQNLYVNEKDLISLD
ncbi:hypothetical protein ACI1UN_10415 [Lactococcus petauri]|uniref:ParM/StbA family protein n=1 Tax=Lactococcus petauri TaxID=1940789 RepID=UPI0038535DDF